VRLDTIGLWTLEGYFEDGVGRGGELIHRGAHREDTVAVMEYIRAVLGMFPVLPPRRPWTEAALIFFILL
jgi:hypothetical protein